MLLEQLCLRLESLTSISNPNVFTARNELGNALRKLATQIDLYKQTSGQLHSGDIDIDCNLMLLQPECLSIANLIETFIEEDQLSPEGIAEFSVVAKEFLDIYRPFYAKL